MLSETYGWFTEGFATPDLIEARTLLDQLAVASGGSGERPTARSMSTRRSERLAKPSRKPTMSGEDKITAAHRARRAVLHLRQSSAGQVRLEGNSSSALVRARSSMVHATRLPFWAPSSLSRMTSRRRCRSLWLRDSVSAATPSAVL